ncbi:MULTISPECIES: ATP-dependent zinc metalloprotease FtsH [unclassified Blautia]|uniref:ATP-dependent zinc metalloprotease FtsH n=1 Tax=Candidatus Blautia stercorigallinarum TaxID=2838501 RepID=A0A9D1PBS6_9FIRM|nr:MULTISPECIES: ATP-dependent zinc metalloprotease FtsH [unclassified Blautia]OUN24962.1 cell division protein FtsH [Blautia sp. An81]OUN91099.1 cell division protein FtsH [Blautia sp. An46]HIV38347.1 ATP-dependent zinc metalloprotease FtsH [Candidatus Blautia stercorigallinarum]
MDIKEKKKPQLPKKPVMFYYLIVLVILAAVNLFLVPSLSESRIQDATYDQFLDDLEAGRISEVNLEEDTIYYLEKDGDQQQVYKTGRIFDVNEVERLDQAGVVFSEEIPQQMNPLLSSLISFVLPLVLLWVVGGWLMKRMMKNMGGMGGPGAMTFGKSNAKIYVKSSTGIKFSDVAGEDEAKELLTELVDYLHNPGKYAEIGASLPKGALLVGPPGTGKTLLAKAVAGEADVPFFSISGSEFVEMFVGMGAAKVRDLFKQANEKAPCIVFIDEIDTIGKKRDGQFAGANDEREQTLNQLLTEMDGFDSSKGVVILAATNRPDSLDPALLRPGRFDRRIPVELPDLKGREEILKVHARKIKISDDVNFSDIAKAAPGASGADLANVVNEAALRAVRDGRKFATQADLEESIEVVIAGYQKKNQVLSNKEKLIVAYHEVGHALVAAMQSHSAPVHKITIIPRTSGALGYTMQVEDGEHYLMSKEELENKIATFTGGRAAEELIFHSITTGASNDIEQATKLARGMITRYGMSQEFGMVAMETVSNQYLGGDSSLTCSFETQTRIDKMVVDLVQKQHDKAVKILEENMPKLHELAKYLYEHETISGEEFMRILTTKPRIAMNQENAEEGSEE